MSCYFNFIEITLHRGCSAVNLLHNFRIPFPKNTCRWLLLSEAIQLANLRVLQCPCKCSNTIQFYKSPKIQFSKNSISLERKIGNILTCSSYITLTVAATGGVIWKKVFLEISRNSQGNTCARDSFVIKLQGLQLYLKRDSGTGAFLWVLWNF